MIPATQRPVSVSSGGRVARKCGEATTHHLSTELDHSCRQCFQTSTNNLRLELLRPPCKFGHDGLKTVRFRCDNNSSTVLEVLKSRGWLQVEGEDESWNLFWCEVTKLRTTLDNRRLEGNQRVPHFRNHYELTRKNLLAKNLKRLRSGSAPFSKKNWVNT
uniref:Tubulin--tyrosine ligase-like protein 9 n=1 Tax=Timema cristinae TaxID=61476 RepID=A0A7R9D5Z6_TIMCR|nr:unnamed protein product [Timema cristinae]